MQDFLNFVQKWFNAFSDLFKNLWHMLYDEGGIMDKIGTDEEDE